MRIGILVNTNNNLEATKGIAQAAVNKGHEVEIFAMDTGTKFLEEASFLDLRNLEGVTMGFCDFSSKNIGANTENLPEGVKRADQWANSIMHNKADRMIIL